MNISCSKVVRAGKTESDFEMLLPVIRSRDSTLLQKTLNEKSVDILNCNYNGWYPLNEAVDMGYVDIAKQIIENAVTHNINILKKWDQQTIRVRYRGSFFLQSCS